MDDVRREIAALRARLRLQTIITLGVLIVMVFAMGGADVVARTAVMMAEADAWKVSTKNAAGTQMKERLIVTTDVDTAQIKVKDANVVLDPTANIVLAQQPAAPGTTTAGTLWYDSTAGKLKYRNANDWAETVTKAEFDAVVPGRLRLLGFATRAADFGASAAGTWDVPDDGGVNPLSVTFTLSSAQTVLVIAQATCIVSHGYTGNPTFFYAYNTAGGAFTDGPGVTSAIGAEPNGQQYLVTPGSFSRPQSLSAGQHTIKARATLLNRDDGARRASISGPITIMVLGY